MGKKTKGRGKQDVSLPFQLRDRVRLKELTTTKYNGMEGEVKSLPKGSQDRYGIRLLKDGKVVGIRTVNIDLVARASKKSTEEQRKERERQESMKTLPEGEIMNANQLRMMRLMMNNLLSEENHIQLFGRKIVPMPDFSEEVLSLDLPLGVNRSWATSYINLAFEQSSGLPHMMELAMKHPEYEPQPVDIVKRLGTNDPRKLAWYFKEGRKQGAVYPENNRTPYSHLIRHSFSNQAYRKEMLHRGTTHVAVGFVDLGVLFAATLCSPPSAKHREGPLKFLGVELSPYAVAKTLVVWEMLKLIPKGKGLTSFERQNRCRSVAQVWFSATWDEGTEEAVKQALEVLCSASNEQHHQFEVQVLLKHWYSAKTLPLKEARSEKEKVTTNEESNIGYLNRRCDRIAMANYELTGDFCVRAPHSGNTLMFDCPDGTPPKENEESVFSALGFDVICSEYLSSSSTIIEAAEEFALAQISKLARWAEDGIVDIELVCADIRDVVDLVMAAQPWTMSWSNVLDYMDHSAFHHLARKCSIHGDTVHFAYSMNWQMMVFGVNIIDYSGFAMSDVRRNLLVNSNEAQKSSYRLLGWHKYLRLPLPTNPINTTSFLLEVAHFQSWANHFFAVARSQGACNVAKVKHVADAPLSRTGASTIFFTWTYDPDITFNCNRPV